MSSEQNEQLARAFTSTRAVLAGVTPEQMDGPTPCASWDVGALVDHIITAPRWGSARLGGEDPEAAGRQDAGAPPLVRYDQTIEQATAAFSRPGALEETVSLPFGDVPGSFLLSMVVTDQFTHGWDLARATGQSTDLDPQLAAELLTQVSIPDDVRGDDGVAPFGPVQAAPAGASPADAVAAYLGRRV